MIREACQADLVGLVELEVQCFGSTAWSWTLVESELSGPDREVLVIEEAGQLIGYGSVMTCGDSADLQRVAIDPTWQRKGHARALLTTLFARADRRGAERILLEVADTNDAALHLYDSMGFTVISRRTRYYTDGSDALVLSRP